MHYTKYLRWTLIGGLFLSLLIPFIIGSGGVIPNGSIGVFNPANILFPLNTFFPFITGKNFVFRILVELLFGVYVLVALREPKYRPRFSLVLAAVLAFALWAGIATVFSVDPVKSFWSNFERMEGYITVLHLLMYFFVAAAVLSAEKLSTWYFRLSLLASACMSFYGLLQLAGKIAIDQGGSRLDGTLGNAIYLAVYMLFNIFFGFILLYRDWSNQTLRFLYAAAILLDVFVLSYTETRGTILGLIAGLLVAAAYLLVATRHDAGWRRLRRVALGSAGALIVVVIAFIALRHQPFIQNTPVFSRLASISLQDKTTEARFMIWHMAWEGFKEKPLTGWGQDNFNFVFNQFYNPAMYDQESWFDRAHNAYLDWLINAGAPGFLLFISLFVAALWAVLRARALSVPERAALLGLIAGFAFHEIFVFDNIVSSIQFFTVLALVHALSEREVPSRVWLTRPLSEKGMAVAAPIVAVLAFGGAWFINAPGIGNATGLITAITTTSPSGQVNLQSNLAEFKTILAGAPLGRQETSEQLIQFALEVGAAQSIDPQTKQDFYATAHDSMVEMTKERPGDARLELFLGQFLDQFGQYPEALTHLKLALAASPGKQATLFELGTNNYLPTGDTKDALAILKTAYEEEPSDDDAAVYYAAALYYALDGSQADALITKQFGGFEPNNDMLVRVYVNTKQYTRAVAIVENRLNKNPTDSQSWQELAAIYYTSGDTASTIAVLKRAEVADPSFGAQAQQLIDQLQTTK